MSGLFTSLLLEVAASLQITHTAFILDIPVQHLVTVRHILEMKWHNVIIYQSLDYTCH